MIDRLHLLILTGCLASAALAASPAAAQDTAAAETEEVDVRWLERLDKVERALLDEHIGFAPPAFRADLTWPDDQPKTWEDLRSSVVVIQSWTTKNNKGRSAPLRAAKALEDFLGSDDLHLIALHTPDGAENAKTFLERREMPATVVIDSSGAYCDDLGMYQEPVNIVVDRTGTVRYAGLKIDALTHAVAKLTAEPFDPAAIAPEKEAADRTDAAEFPAFSGMMANALDVRGKQAPTFAVNEWVTTAPQMENKVVVVDFWATWCGPCIQSIPHMNDLARSFSGDVACIGISDEQRTAFYDGMRRRNLTTSDFAYALALDPRKRMYGALRVRAIPHCMVVSSDGIVRWQGHPASLRKETLGQIVQANRTLLGTARPRRWGTKG